MAHPFSGILFGLVLSIWLIGCACSNGQIVQASCGQCQFDMKEKKGCDLAVQIDGKAYFVDGSSIDDHGDAHATDGFCNAVRRACVRGRVEDGRFQATCVKLVD